jgi:hypothetical protein
MLGAFAACIVCGVDWHWTSVVRFQASHPTQNKQPIEWLVSDSDQMFAFKHVESAPEHKLIYNESEKKLELPSDFDHFH